MTGTQSDQLTLPDPNKYLTAALDIGVAHTGISIWDSGSYIKSFTIECSHPDSARQPIEMARLFIRHLLPLSCQSPLLVLIEDYAYGGGFFNAKQAEMAGILKMFVMAERSDCVVGLIGVAPNTLKKIITGNGRAKKSLVSKCIKAKGYDTADSHEADSIGVYLSYLELWDKPTDDMYARSIINKELL